MRLPKKKAARRALWILAIAALWQIVAVCGWVSPLLLPGPGAVLTALWQSLINGELVEQIGFSLLVIAVGIALAGLIGLLFAALSLRSEVFASLADALSVLAHPLPAIALLPIIIVWFGLGGEAIVAVIVHSVLWPVLINLTAGFRAVPKLYAEIGSSLSLNPIRKLCSIFLPASAAYLLSGARIGWARAWRALISAEMVFGAVGNSGGLGWYIFKSRVLMDPPGLFAGILVVILIGSLVESLMDLAERKTIARWGMV